MLSDAKNTIIGIIIKVWNYLFSRRNLKNEILNICDGMIKLMEYFDLKLGEGGSICQTKKF